MGVGCRAVVEALQQLAAGARPAHGVVAPRCGIGADREGCGQHGDANGPGGGPAAAVRLPFAGPHAVGVAPGALSGKGLGTIPARVGAAPVARSGLLLELEAGRARGLGPGDRVAARARARRNGQRRPGGRRVDRGAGHSHGQGVVVGRQAADRAAHGKADVLAIRQRVAVAAGRLAGKGLGGPRAVEDERAAFIKLVPGGAGHGGPGDRVRPVGGRVGRGGKPRVSGGAGDQADRQRQRPPVPEPASEAPGGRLRLRFGQGAAGIAPQILGRGWRRWRRESARQQVAGNEALDWVHVRVSGWLAPTASGPPARPAGGGIRGGLLERTPGLAIENPLRVLPGFSG